MDADREKGRVMLTEGRYSSRRKNGRSRRRTGRRSRYWRTRDAIPSSRLRRIKWLQYEEREKNTANHTTNRTRRERSVKPLSTPISNCRGANDKGQVPRQTGSEPPPDRNLVAGQYREGYTAKQTKVDFTKETPVRWNQTGGR